ncbi:MAG: tetratricopeptide repeat protein [Acidobacteria bacterium]|jgi:tetratricopeptide (TPR) repeat protein|nr:tetratricopeptide repeat protein [Acidobacteriota bacterium]
MKRKSIGLRKMRKGTSLLLLLLVLFFIIGSEITFGQEAFKMDENTFQKFKLAKRMFEKGQEYFLQEKFAKAEEALLECLKNFPTYSQADYFLSQIYYKKGDFDKALEHINNAKANYKSMADLLVASQQKYFDELRKAKQEQQNILINLTNKDEIARTKREIEVINSRLNEPLPIISEISADYYYVAGNIFMKLKKYNDAHAQYSEAIRINPLHGNAGNNLASLYYMIKKYQKALDYLNQAETNGIKVNQEFKKAILKALENGN